MKRKYKAGAFNDTDVQTSLALYHWKKMIDKATDGLEICADWRYFSKFNKWYEDQMYRGEGTVLWLKEGATVFNPDNCELLLHCEIADRIESEALSANLMPRDPRIIQGYAVDDAPYRAPDCPIFATWLSLVKRKVELDAAWLSFSNFRQWYLTQPFAGRMRHDGSDRPYGPATCVLIQVQMICDSPDRGVAYVAWRRVCSRVYQSGSPYTVCAAWRSFKAFKLWFNEHGAHGGEYVVIINGATEYSPKNCKLVSRKELEQFKRVAFCGKSGQWAVKQGARVLCRKSTEQDAIDAADM